MKRQKKFMLYFSVSVLVLMAFMLTITDPKIVKKVAQLLKLGGDEMCMVTGIQMTELQF